MFHPASGSFPFSPSPSSVPSVANCVGTFRLKSFSDDLTNSSLVSSEPEPDDGRLPTGDHKYFFQLVAKNRSERHYRYKEFSGVGGVQSRRAIEYLAETSRIVFVKRPQERMLSFQ
jgi:hypothetical protein